jgi:raffinose/stachyose/melibiose transport system substrate-binding protein
MKTLRFLLFVLVTISLVACGVQPSQAPVEDPSVPATEVPATEPASAEPVSLVMGSWRVDDSAAWGAILDAFHAEYPNITVSFDPTNPPDYNATIQTQMETGTGPDLLFVRSFATGRSWFEQGFVASLQDLPGLADAIPPASNAPWATEAGEPFAVPIAAVSHGIYYNQDLFAANNIEIPTTWEELMAASETLKAAGVYPFANGTKDEWDINEVVWMALVPNNVGGMEGRLEYLNGDRCFNDADITASFQQIQDLTPYLPDGFTATNYYDAQQLFIQGKAAMMFDGSWSITAIQQAQPEFNWSVFAVPPPAGKEEYISFHMDAAIGMNPATEHPEAARTFLQWLETPEFAEMFGNGVPGFFPVTNEVPALTDEVANTFLSFNSEAAGTDIRFTWDKLMDPPSGETSAYSASNAGAIAVLTGASTPQGAADDLQNALAAWYAPASTCPQ